MSFEIPAPGAGTRDAYLRFIPRNEMDIAVVGSGVSVTLDASGNLHRRARGARSGGADRDHGSRRGGSADRNRRSTTATWSAPGAAASAASRPITDRRGTAEFRRHVAGVLTRRAAAAARDRARASL